MRVDPFFSQHVIVMRRRLVFGKPGHQWGVYRRHRESRKEIEFGIVINGSAMGILIDYM